ncbi:MAG: hypothetical protein ACRC92_23915 [Peptostreptococcaceae bacterium]
MFTDADIIYTLTRDSDTGSLVSGVSLIDPTKNANGKAVSDIEKKFKEPVRKLNSFIKEVDTDGRKVRERIKEHRENFPHDTEFESNMYRNLGTLSSNKLAAIKESIRVTEVIVKLEHAAAKLDIDGKVGGAIATSAMGGSDMKSLVAHQYMNGGAGGALNVGTAMLTGNQTGLAPEVFNGILNAEKVDETDVALNVVTNDVTFVQQGGQQDNQQVESSNVTQTPTNTGVADATPSVTPKGNIVSTSGDILPPGGLNIGEFKETDNMGVSYEHAANCLQMRNATVIEVIKLDKEAQQYWIELRDPDGNTIDKGRRKHIESLGNVDFTMADQGVAKDTFGVTYSLEYDNINNMPKEYIEQWEKYGR